MIAGAYFALNACLKFLLAILTSLPVSPFSRFLPYAGSRPPHGSLLWKPVSDSYKTILSGRGFLEKRPLTHSRTWATCNPEGTRAQWLLAETICTCMEGFRCGGKHFCDKQCTFGRREFMMFRISMWVSCLWVLLVHWLLSWKAEHVFSKEVTKPVMSRKPWGQTVGFPEPVRSRECDIRCSVCHHCVRGECRGRAFCTGHRDSKKGRKWLIHPAFSTVALGLVWFL